MRHGKKFNHLGRTASHRKAMLANMAVSLIMHKRITTTVAKAKALRQYVEPLITKAKNDTTHSRRVVFSYLQNKEAIKELFGEVADKVAERPGGYTRILRTGYRLGDNAEMCIIELVDYNEAMLKEAKPAKSKTRRSRRGKGGAKKAEQPAAAKQETAQEKPAETEATAAAPAEEVAEEVAEEATAETVSETAEQPAAEVEEAATEEAPAAEAKEEPAAEEKQEEKPADEGDKEEDKKE